jgi:hypothetical protein
MGSNPPAYQFPTSLPVGNQPAGKVQIQSQDKFLTATVLLSDIGTGLRVESESQIASQDTLVNAGLSLTCLGGRPNTPPDGAVIGSSDTYVSEGVRLPSVIIK